MSKINTIVMTGDAGFIKRYRIFREALADRYASVTALPSGDTYSATLSGKAVKAVYKIARTVDPKKSLGLGDMHKQKTAFLRKSRQTEEKIRHLSPQPDLAFHLFGMYAPFLHGSRIPFTMTLDYTMALAAEQWPPWAPFPNSAARDAWLTAEKDAYARAAHLFPWSEMVKRSLMQDYAVPAEKITVTGSSGQFRAPYDGPKSFGTRRIIFNGSEWERKGGDLLLTAFQQVRRSLPDAVLVVVGAPSAITQPGVLCPGYISSPAEMQTLFLDSDLLVAPARCEPYGGFLVEGMNYGVPCLVSNHGGMPEIVDHGVNGLVLEETTPDTLAEAIVSLLGDPARLERFSVSAREKVRTTLNWDRIADKIFGALQARGILS